MLYPAHWPACWLFTLHGDVSGRDNRYEFGERTTMDRVGRLVYSCACGEKFARAPGELVADARAWVIEHTPHVEVNVIRLSARGEQSPPPLLP